MHLTILANGLHADIHQTFAILQLRADPTLTDRKLVHLSVSKILIQAQRTYRLDIPSRTLEQIQLMSE